MSAERLNRGPASYLLKADRGHRYVCGGCAARHGEDLSLIGKERWLEWKDCGKCPGARAIRMLKASLGFL